MFEANRIASDYLCSRISPSRKILAIKFQHNLQETIVVTFTFLDVNFLFQLGWLFLVPFPLSTEGITATIFKPASQR